MAGAAGDADQRLTWLTGRGMSTNEEHRPSEVPPSAAPVPEPSTPFEYRDSMPEAAFRLVSAAVTISLVADSAARYRFECELETRGDTPAEFWFSGDRGAPGRGLVPWRA